MNKSIKKELLFFLFLVLFGCTFIYFWLVIVGNQPQVFNDVIVEYTSKDRSNKSGERTLVYLLSLLGFLFIFLFYNKTNSNHEVLKYNNHIIFFTKIKNIILKNKLYEFITLFIIICFFEIGIIRLVYNFINIKYQISIILIIIPSLFISVFLLLVYKSNKIIVNRIALFIQLFVPFSLFIYNSKLYNYNGALNNIGINLKSLVFIWLIIICLISSVVYDIHLNWSKESLFDCISISTVISIFAFLNHSGNGIIITDDFHHPFENIITYFQIIDKGSVPFKDYIPVSGMFAMIQGFFLSFFGDGKFSQYYITENIFYLIIIIVVVLLLKRFFSLSDLLFLSFVIPIVKYNRIVFIIPFMIILLNDKLIKNRSAWILAWYFSSLFYGLYYPLFGAAVSLAFLPMLIYQIYLIIINKELLGIIHNKKKIVGFIFCLIITALSVPLLFNMAKHTLIMSSQTIYADGISRFGQIFSKDFLPFLGDSSIKLFIFYLACFFIPISICWTSFVLAMKVGRMYIVDNKVIIENKKAFCSCLSIAIMALISFSYTFVRGDIYTVYSRSSGIVVASSLIFLLICKKYSKNDFYSFLLVFYSLMILILSPKEIYNNIINNNKLSSYYNVSSDYTYSDDDISNLGRCYLSKKSLSELQFMKSITENKKYNKFMGIGHFGHYYLSDIKGVATIELTTLRGYKSINESIEIIKKEKPIIGMTNEDIINSYYLYNWLMTSGEYYWNESDKFFYPNDNFYTKSETNELNSCCINSIIDINLERTPSSWGESFGSLNHIFTQNNTSIIVDNENDFINLHFESSIKGEDADFLYLEFNEPSPTVVYSQFDYGYFYYKNVDNPLAKGLYKKEYNPDEKIYVSWIDDMGETAYISCNYENGKLLIPLGVGRGWLLNNHQDLLIYMNKDEKLMDMPDVVSVKLLKLRRCSDEEG